MKKVPNNEVNEKNESDQGNFYEADDGEPEASSTVRRSERSNRGIRPKHLDDNDLDYVASCAAEEPVTVKETIQEPVWRNAMEEEMEAHRVNGTWRLVPELPEGRKVIGSRWVYKGEEK